MVKQFREAEQKQLGYSNLRDSDVLKALVFLVRLGHGRTSGRPKSRAFIDFLFAQFPEKAIGRGRAAGSGEPDHRAVAKNLPRIFTDSTDQTSFENNQIRRYLIASDPC